MYRTLVATVLCWVGSGGGISAVLPVLALAGPAAGQMVGFKLQGDDGSKDDWFGTSVAIDGETIVVGAPAKRSPEGISQGAVYVFGPANGAWRQEAALRASDPALVDQLGNSVAVSGDTIAVGASRKNALHGHWQGAVYVFERAGATWTQGVKLVAPDAKPYDQFGGAVALAGDTLLVGATRPGRQMESRRGARPGVVYAFRRSAGAWMLEGTLTPDDSSRADMFGMSVAISGDRAIIGRRGAACVFRRSADGWTQEATLRARDAGGDEYFGSSVSLEGDTAVVAAPFSKKGAAYVFTRSAGAWKQRAKLSPPQPREQDRFGMGVALSGEAVVVGAEGRGTAFVFRRADGSWSEGLELRPPDPRPYDTFGHAVAVHGGTAVVGAYMNDGPGGERQGAAYVVTGVAPPAPPGPRPGAR